MYIKSKSYDNALRKVKIEFGTLIGLEEDQEAYVTLKELSTMETLNLKEVSQTGDQTSMMAYFKQVLPKIIVAHNLYETENTIMTPEAVADFIFEKLELTSKVMAEYTKAMFRVNKSADNGNKGDKQDDIPEPVQSGSI